MSHIALLGTQLFFAINYTAIKYLMQQNYAGPFAINLIRVLVATALLWLLYFFKKEKVGIRRKDWGRFLLCAFFGIAANQMLFIKGLSYTSTLHASLLILATPILITILAIWFFGEKLTSLKSIGLLMGLGGAAMLIASKHSAAEGSNVLLGDVLVFVNAMSYAIYFILVKPLMEHYHPIAVVRMAFTLGLVMMLPFCYAEFAAVNWMHLSPLAIVCMVSISILGTFFAYVFNIYGIKNLGPAIAGTYIYFQPIFATIIAFYAMGENITWFKIVAGLCIGIGVYLTNYQKKDKSDLVVME